MALTLIAAYTRSAWRIRALFAGGDPSAQLLTAFSIARVDGGPSTLTLASKVSPDTGQLELSTSEPMLRDVPYLLTFAGGGTARVLYQLAPGDPQLALEVDDPEAEIFGVDLDWIYGTPGGDGDCPQRRGQACLVHDLKALAMLDKGDLVHLPTRGAGQSRSVNATASPAELDAARGTIAAEFRADDRVADLSITVSPGDDDGEFEYDARVVPVGTGRPLQVSNT